MFVMPRGIRFATAGEVESGVFADHDGPGFVAAVFEGGYREPRVEAEPGWIAAGGFLDSVLFRLCPTAHDAWGARFWRIADAWVVRYPDEAMPGEFVPRWAYYASLDAMLAEIGAAPGDGEGGRR